MEIIVFSFLLLRFYFFIFAEERMEKWNMNCTLCMFDLFVYCIYVKMNFASRVIAEQKEVNGKKILYFCWKNWLNRAKYWIGGGGIQTNKPISAYWNRKQTHTCMHILIMKSDMIPHSVRFIAYKRYKKRRSERREILTSDTRTTTIDRLFKFHSKQIEL